MLPTCYAYLMFTENIKHNNRKSKSLKDECLRTFISLKNFMNKFQVAFKTFIKKHKVLKYLSLCNSASTSIEKLLQM